MRKVITVDGPSGVGKGTLCQNLARELGWAYLDSGALYRLLALRALAAGKADAAAAEIAALTTDLQIDFRLDMGTVIFPDAPLKFFLTASSEIRAERRHKQLLAKGECVNVRDIYAEIVERDKRDQTRSVAPLKPASDAVIIDTGELSIQDVHQQVSKEIAARFSFS